MSPIQIESPGTKRVGVKYVVAVAGLLVIIAAVLAQLWLIERHRRIVAEERLTALYLEKELLAAAEDAADREEGGVRLRPVRRGDLPAQEVRWNGVKRMALVLGTAAGRAMGFAPGDVIVVAGEASTTAPAGGAAGERRHRVAHAARRRNGHLTIRGLGQQRITHAQRRAQPGDYRRNAA